MFINKNMAYEVSNNNNVHFVTSSVNGRVLARFDGRDGENPKEQAKTKARELASEEKAWKRAIS